MQARVKPGRKRNLGNVMHTTTSFGASTLDENSSSLPQTRTGHGRNFLPSLGRTNNTAAASRELPAGLFTTRNAAVRGATVQGGRQITSPLNSLVNRQTFTGLPKKQRNNASMGTGGGNRQVHAANAWVGALPASL